MSTQWIRIRAAGKLPVLASKLDGYQVHVAPGNVTVLPWATLGEG